MITFTKLSEHNLARLQEGRFSNGPCQHNDLDSWSPAEWSNAVAGEVGELCNLTKKLLRGDDIDVHDIAREAADVVIYLDLLAQRLGFDLGTAVVKKFNEKSRQIGSDVIIRDPL